MAVKVSAEYKTLRKDWSIYRIDLDTLEAKLWKFFTNSTEEEMDLHMLKYRKFVNKHDHSTAFIKKETKTNESRIIIPIL